MIAGEIQYMRKHTGSVVQELNDKIVNSIGQLSTTFDLCKRHSNQMKQVQVDKTASAELCGRLFLENDLITSTQLGIIKRELNEPTFKDFTDPTVWSLYNYITYSLKEAHPSQYMKQHINVHKFFEEEFSLV